MSVLFLTKDCRNKAMMNSGCLEPAVAFLLVASHSSNYFSGATLSLLCSVYYFSCLPGAGERGRKDGRPLHALGFLRKTE